MKVDFQLVAERLDARTNPAFRNTSELSMLIEYNRDKESNVTKIRVDLQKSNRHFSSVYNVMNEKSNIIYKPKLTFSHSLSLLTPCTPAHAIINKSSLTSEALPSR